MYKPGDMLKVSESKTVRLNKDTAEIANAAADCWVARFADRTKYALEEMAGLHPEFGAGLVVAREVVVELADKNTATLYEDIVKNSGVSNDSLDDLGEMTPLDTSHLDVILPVDEKLPPSS